MVKNLPTVERSTKIRFGKHVPDSMDQEENTIVFNASNISVPTPYSNSVYLSPIRNRSDYQAPEIVLLMYDRNTKEITESGESANALIGGSTLDTVVQRSNATSNTVQFVGAFNKVGFVTDSNVGISNLEPQHTVSVGSNLYIDDMGSNVLVVSGNVAILDNLVVDGNLTVNGGTTVIITENLSVGDAIIEIGRNNTSEDTTLDLGLLMHRPETESNVIIGFRESSNEFAIAYTEASPHDKTFTPKTDEDINVHVYGLTHVDANIYAHEDLLVTGNVYVSGNVSITEELTVSNNVYADKDLEVLGNVYADGNVVAYKDLLVSGNVYVSTNVDITEELTVTGNVYADKDLEVLGNVYADGNVVAYKDLLVTGNVYADGNVVAYKDLLVTGNVYVSTNVDITEELTVTGNVYADKDLEVMGNTYVTGNVVAYKDLLVSGNVYVSTNVDITEELTVTGNVYADKDLEIMGNVYADGNVVAYKDLLVTGNTYVTGNVQVTKALVVSGNTHLEGNNVFVTHTMDFLDPTTAIVTDQISNVQIRLGQLENVSNTVSNPSEDHVIVYNGSQWLNDYPLHTYIKIRNDELSSNIEKGDAVYVKGTYSFDTLNVGLAQSNVAVTMPCIGLSNQALIPDEEGVAISYGKSYSVNTGTFVEGEQVYVSNIVPGGLSNIRPYGLTELIQNVGIVTRVNNDDGGVFVTGIGRANDVPNADLITDYNDMNYVYVNNENNDFCKIAPQNLNIPLTTAVSSSSNSAANAVTLRGVSITSGDGFHGDLVVAGNVTVDSTTLHVDAETNRVGLGTITPKSTLDIVGNVHVTSNISTSSNVLIIGTAASTSKTTGALQVIGGVGIQGNINATYANIESVTITDATHSTSKDTGALVVTQGGLGVEANIHSTNVFASSHIGVGTSATSNTFDVRGTANVGALVATSTHISDSTSATTKTSGALRVAGGLGVVGAIHAADITVDSVSPLNLTNTHIPFANANKKLVDSLITQSADGTILISANLEIAGNISVLGNSFAITSNDLIINDRIIDIANNNVSQELDVGILMEHPGKNIFIGHHTSPHDDFSIGYTNAGYADDHIDWNGTEHITANIWGHLITQNTVTVQYGNVYIVDGGLGIGIGDGENDDVPDSKLYVTGNAHFTSNISTDSNVLISGDAAATSTTTGALQVVGGMGVGGAIHSGGGISAAYDQDVTSYIGKSALGGITYGATFAHKDMNTQFRYALRQTSVGKTMINTKGDQSISFRVGDTEKASLTSGGDFIVDTNTLYVSAANNMVGISNDTPVKKLHIKTFSNEIMAGLDHVTTTGSGGNDEYIGMGFGVTAQGQANRIFKGGIFFERKGGDTGRGDLLFCIENTQNNSTEVSPANAIMRITRNSVVSITGNVGINKAEPEYALDVLGDINFTGDLYEGGNLFVSTPWTIETTPDALSYIAGNVGIGEATPDATLHVTGNAYVTTNLHASNVYTSGGLITNTAGTAKKTYSHTDSLPTNASIANGTFQIVFSNHVFQAKIYAVLVEGTVTVSSITQEVCGGHISGGTPAAITLGSTNVIGHSAYPWDTVVASNGTTVTIKAKQVLSGTGNYNIFVEYLSAHTGGRVLKFTRGGVDQIVFNY